MIENHRVLIVIDPTRDALVRKARALGVSAGTLGSLVTEALR